MRAHARTHLITINVICYYYYFIALTWNDVYCNQAQNCF